MYENMFDLGLDVATISAELPDPVITLTGSDNYTVPNTADYPLLALSLYGESVQDTSTGGEPAGKNFWNNSKSILSSTTAFAKTDTGFIFTRGNLTGGVAVYFKTPIYKGESITFSVKGNNYQPQLYIYKDKMYGTVAARSITPLAYTATEDLPSAVFAIIINSTDNDLEVSDIQIELGSTATAYEPYVGKPTPDAPIPIESVGDDGNVVVTACGKNLLFQTSRTETINGITFTPQEDGSILMNGTSTGDVIYSIYQFERTDKSLFFAGGDYTISFGDEVDALAKNNPKAVFIVLGYHDDETDTNTYPVWKNESVSTFSTDILFEKRNFIVRLRMYTGIVCDNVRIYPQIERGAIATAYEPYKDSTVTITSGLPLCSVGEYHDELIYNAEGTGKIIKHIRRVVFDGSENWNRTTTTEGGYRFTLNISGYECLYGDSYTNNTMSLVVSDQYNAIAYKQAGGGNEGIATLHTTGMHLTICDGNYAMATVDEWKTHLAQNPLTVLYVLNTPQEIELTSAEILELKQLQSFEDVTNIYNNEQAEMSVKILRREFDMKYVEWLKESQTWICPKAGKWKVIAVGGGASGSYTASNGTTPLVQGNGGTTSFGSILSASGGIIPESGGFPGTARMTTQPSVSFASGENGYDGMSYGGSSSFFASSNQSWAANGESRLSAKARGYGASGGSSAHKLNYTYQSTSSTSTGQHEVSPFTTPCGEIESTIVDLEEGQNVFCTIGKGGVPTPLDGTTLLTALKGAVSNATSVTSTEAEMVRTVSPGRDGVIVVQYLGY